MASHRWDHDLRNLKKVTPEKGGGIAACTKCGYIKEFVKGVPTFYRDDSVVDRFAPKCDERNIQP